MEAKSYQKTIKERMIVHKLRFSRNVEDVEKEMTGANGMGRCVVLGRERWDGKAGRKRTSG